MIPKAFISLLITLVIGLPAKAFSQDQYRHYAPTKDVAMLVDVSVSVRDDKKGHEAARTIIQDILTGKPFANPNWVVEPGQPEMKDLFAAYLGVPPSAASPPAELRPLMASGNSFLSLPVGELSTVLNGEINRKLRDVQGIRDLVADGYPKQMNDTSTCYWFAMAQAADTLSQKSRLGYYLFVVSDEEDDPDYRKDGPPNHTKADYDKYLKDLEPRYPVESIRAAIGKYFVPAKPSARDAEKYESRNTFKQALIARFYQKGARSDPNARQQKVTLSWYAMGVTPERVLVPREPPKPVPGQPAPAPVASYKAPVLAPRLQLLGGLESGKKKTFGYGEPIIVWQIANIENRGWDAGKPRIELEGSGSKLGNVVDGSPRKTIKSWRLSEQLKNGTHTLELEIEDAGGGTGDDDLRKDIHLIKTAGSRLWLTILAVVSSVAALAIFIFAWRSLRQTRVVSPA